MLGALASAIVDLFASGATEDFARFFSNVEQSLGDDSQRNLVVVGLLEGIQNVSLNRGLGIDAFGQWLGPITDRYWRALMDFWAGRITPQEFNASIRPAAKD